MIPERFTKWNEARAARHEPEARRLLARTYWAFLICSVTLVGVFSIGYGVWEFMRPLEKSESEVVVGASKTILNRVELQAILDGFDLRTDRFEERRVAPAVRDPS